MGLFRKVVHIGAEHSPNVRVAKAREAKGIKGPHPCLVPGVVMYVDYLRRDKLWDNVKRTIRLNGHFYEGAEVLLYPPDWLDRAERIAEGIANKRRQAKAMGIDPAEGGDNTVWVVIDELGILKIVALQTEDTAKIGGRTLGLLKEFNLNADRAFFDRGGGGKQHADYLRAKGHKVQTVGFGESATDPEKFVSKRIRPMDKKVDLSEMGTVYKNRRAEMYGLLRIQLDPTNENGFGIPAEYTELRRQLSPLPLLYDGEGRIWLPPKDKPSPNYQGDTIKQILGCSPDYADGLVLAVFGMIRKPPKRKQRTY